MNVDNLRDNKIVFSKLKFYQSLARHFLLSFLTPIPAYPLGLIYYAWAGSEIVAEERSHRKMMLPWLFISLLGNMSFVFLFLRDASLDFYLFSLAMTAASSIAGIIYRQIKDQKRRIIHQ